jgi:glycosyltransferase involved in cell wall biosynthesis
MQKISLTITTYNRFELTIKSFEKVIDDDRIGDILILDDCSTDGSYEKLSEYFDSHWKVRVVQQIENRGMALNKKMAIGLSKYPFTIILDSDNIIDKSYLYAIPDLLDVDTIYMPEFSEPQFDFTKFAGQTIDKSNVKEFISDPMGNVCANACNYLVNADKYLEVFEEDSTVKESDTINFFYLWMKAGYKFHIVKGMRYFHLVHPESGWLQNANYNMKKGEEIRNKILEL